MAAATRRVGKSPMTSEQEQLEQRLQNMEELMARMSGMMETLVQNQDQPLRLIDEEQADMLQAQLQAEWEKAAAEVATSGTTAADQKGDSVARVTYCMLSPTQYGTRVKSVIHKQRSFNPRRYMTIHEDVENF